MTQERFKELLKPIADGLFGKQRTRYGERPHYTVRPVGMIVEDLCRIPEEDWALYAFSREPLNGKFTDDQRRDLTRQAIACGRAYADKLAAQYGMRDPEKLAARLGLEVDFPDVPQNASRVLFAEFREPNKVHIYMDGVRKGRALLGEPGVPHALGGQLDIAKLLIGHELFHYVEEQHKKRSGPAPTRSSCGRPSFCTTVPPSAYWARSRPWRLRARSTACRIRPMSWTPSSSTATRPRKPAACMKR